MRLALSTYPMLVYCPKCRASFLFQFLDDTLHDGLIVLEELTEVDRVDWKKEGF